MNRIRIKEKVIYNEILYAFGKLEYGRVELVQKDARCSSFRINTRFKVLIYLKKIIFKLIYNSSNQKHCLRSPR